MSRLQALIERYCPDGVEYKALGELGTLTRGKRFVRNDFVEDGTPCIHYGELYTYYGVSATKCKSHVRNEIAAKLRYAQPGDVVIVGAGETVEDIGLGVAWLGNTPVAVHDACYTLHQSELDPVFVSYFLRTDDYHAQIRKYIGSSKISSVSGKGLAQARIPVPPIEVQREVVRILDEYTAAHDELVIQLEEEMRLRGRQHRDAKQTLFDSCGGDTKTIGELFPFIRNGFVGTVSNHFSDCDHGVRYLEGTNIHDGHISDNEEIYVTREFHEAHLRSELKPTDIVVVQSGHVGECAVVGEKYAGGNCHALIVMSNGGQCVSQFVVQYLYSAEGRRQLDKMTTGGTVKHILASKIGKISLPLPTMVRQQEIVAVIDEMDRSYRELTNSLQEEINAHKQQLSLLRNQLLSFPEKVA